MPVQWVCRPSQDFRGFAGQVAAGEIRVGDEVLSASSGQRSRVSTLSLGEAAIEVAREGQSVMLTLEDEIDVSRGDVIAAAVEPPPVSDQFGAHLLWMGDEARVPGRPTDEDRGAHGCRASDRDQYKATSIPRNISPPATGVERSRGLQPEPGPAGGFRVARDTACLQLHPHNRQTLGPRGLRYARLRLRRAANVHWQALDVDQRAAIRSRPAAALPLVPPACRDRGSPPSPTWFESGSSLPDTNLPA